MTEKWNNLILALRRLPGMGPKMAERIALQVLKSPAETEGLIQAIQEAQQNLRRCNLCGIYTEENPCKRCTDSSRVKSLLCVVEEASDLLALERAGAFKGSYHLLGGVLSPLDGIGPRQLRIEPLMERLTKDDPRIDEVILATNPTIEGEATATYLAQLVHPLGKKVTRLAYGLPSGSTLEYADELTLSRAFEGRKEL
jgi:recombination protein RecR